MDGPRGSSLTPWAIVVASSLASVIGSSWGGAAGSLVAGSVTFFGAWAIVIARRLWRTRRILDPGASVPNLEKLAPEQALALLSVAASSTTHGTVPVFSEVLKALDAIRRRAAESPEDALDALHQAHALQREHPRNPAVAAALARLHRDLGRLPSAFEHAGTAITLAVEGGMNPAAARVFREFSDGREHLQIPPRLHERLARILESHGNLEGAAWCRAQSNEGGAHPALSVRE